MSSVSAPETMRVLALRVEFAAEDTSTTTGNGKFDFSTDTDPYRIDPPPHNREYFEDHLLFLKNYFLSVSHGQLTVEGDVFPQENNAAYQLDHPMTYYNPNTTPDKINEGLARLFRDAVRKADADPAIHFSDYQSFIIFHAGVGKDVDLGFDETPQDIPSLFLTSGFLRENLGDSGIPVDDGAFVVENGMLLPETESQVEIELGLNGILVSNFGSQLGWLDLFSPVTRRSGIGRFGLMDAGLFNGDGLLPAVPCAWTRIEAGWEQANDIYYANNDKFSIHSPASSSPDRVYRVPINEDEYFLVENRYAGEKNLDSLRYEMGRDRDVYPNVKEVLLTHFADQVTFSERGVLVDLENFDLGLPGTGCLIWHIDDKVIEQNRADNRINADPEHRGVDLEEADGSQDIGQEFDLLSAGSGSETGWVLDMWYAGNDAPLFEEDNNTFSANTIPNSRSYYNRANSHITISDFSGPDSVMTFRVKLNIFQQNFPLSVDPEIYGRITSLKVSDLNADGEQEMILTTDRGKILAVNAAAGPVGGMDSLEILDISEDLRTPPVLFDATLAGVRQKRMVLLSAAGRVLGFSFTENQPPDTLFPAFSVGDSITTYPTGVRENEETVSVYWGTSRGRVYRLNIQGNELPFDTTSYSIGEPVAYLHTDDLQRVWAVGRSGTVYLDGEFVMNGQPLPHPPAGNIPAALTGDGRLADLSGSLGEFAESGLFRFDSPLISFPVVDIDGTSYRYFAAGDNRLYAFNDNFTLLENFPRKMYRPYRETRLFLSPLLGVFQDQSLAETVGVLVTDPAGIIDGYDLKAGRLANFPLAAGDSIIVTPALLNIDGDPDMELAAVTRGNKLYVWDLPATATVDGWHQLYQDELNSNRNTILPAANPGGSPAAASTLLPAEKVYNWPNPNTDDYTFIRYYLGQAADVTVKVYDLAGDQVAELDAPSAAKTANEVRWDLRNIQSGVYLARVEAKNDRGSEVRIIKIAVIK